MKVAGPQERRWTFYLLAVALLSLPIYFTLKQLAMLALYRPAPATVLEIRIDDRRGKGGRRLYTPVVVYQYQRSGHSFSGSRFRPAAVVRRDRQDAASLVAPYRVSQTVIVFASPLKPELSFLQFKFDWVPASGILVAVFVLVPFYRQLVQNRE
jgi:hypothetical protein